ncbi:hypothetical protein BDP27DRAFT_1310088 [Rhodocollybia butyracea]|uniref:Uncharacterized protein n=1 Tax=Rhodocollybia butyracea TaxID=206335 RepID=A0A9P5QC25_9AGAR|nr:hypothetical protein BDP27DRAFT_1310088 [Rhodocollybia butyracea]
MHSNANRAIYKIYASEFGRCVDLLFNNILPLCLKSFPSRVDEERVETGEDNAERIEDEDEPIDSAVKHVVPGSQGVNSCQSGGEGGLLGSWEFLISTVLCCRGDRLFPLWNHLRPCGYILGRTLILILIPFYVYPCPGTCQEHKRSAMDLNLPFEAPPGHRRRTNPQSWT